MPITQTVVIAAISSTAPITIAAFEGSTSISSKKKRTATSASEPITRIPVMQTAQPAIQPVLGPIARVTHEKVVPQSWSALFSQKKAAAMKNIGTKATRSDAGA